MADIKKSFSYPEIVRRMRNIAEAMIQMNGGLTDALRRTLYQKADEFGVHIQDMENILKAQVPATIINDITGSDDVFDLSRFIKAQKNIYDNVLAELRSGWKRSHWMWYIFPQIDKLGESATSKRYAITNLEEARQYLIHPVLGTRLLKCAKMVLAIEGRSVAEIFGYPDDLKLKSSMTLFSCVPEADPVFKHVLEKYFHGSLDFGTINQLELLSEQCIDNSGME